MKFLHHGAWLIVAVILQSMIFNYISVLGVHPELFVLIVAAIALLCGNIQGMVCGMVFGLVYDILIGRAVGTNMLSFAVIGYVCGIIGGKYYTAPPFYVFMIIGAAVTAAAELIYLVPCVIGLQIDVPILYGLRTVLIEALMNGILIVPVLWCVGRTLNLFKIQTLNSFR